MSREDIGQVQRHAFVHDIDFSLTFVDAETIGYAVIIGSKINRYATLERESQLVGFVGHFREFQRHNRPNRFINFDALGAFQLGFCAKHFLANLKRERTILQNRFATIKSAIGKPFSDSHFDANFSVGRS